ncbi:MAG: ankyrin repeat domain-containing protein [Puniceicoccales bacterium]|nr:ankyrin repeat domain-containing protein [Puniceicoccales bacterium]
MKIGTWRIIAGAVLLHSTAVAVPDRSEIWEAVRDGNLEKVQEIVSTWPRSVNDVSDIDGPHQGMTPLMLAIIFGEDPIVDWMLRHGDVNFFKKEPLRGDNILLLAIRCSGYTHILDSVIRYWESFFRMSLAGNTPPKQRKALAEKLRKIFAYRNYDRENVFDLIIRDNVINKTAVLGRLLAIGLKPTWVPFETSRVYEPGQLPTHPLFVLYWQREWEAFFVLAQHYPMFMFYSIEFPATKQFLRRFGWQPVIAKILEPDTFPEFRAAVRRYGIHNPFLQLVCGIPPTDRQRLPPAFINTQSSDGYTPLDIFLMGTQRLIALGTTQEEISKLEAMARGMGLPVP